MACASTVAVVVPSPAVSEVLLATSRTIWAPMFSSGSLRSISLATVTPSLVIVGDPNFLSRTTLRPFGPRVTLTASANWLTPRSTACRDCSPYTICFAMTLSPVGQVLWTRRLLDGLRESGMAGSQPPPPWAPAIAEASREGRSRGLLFLARLVDHGEHFVFAHDEEFLTFQLDFLAGVLAEQNEIAGLHV